MREIDVNTLTYLISSNIIKANCHIDDSLLTALKEAKSTEESTIAKGILAEIIENDELASKTCSPICQDTGIVVCFIELGYDVHLNGDLYKAINEGIKDGYEKGFLRKSVVDNPLTRRNTNTNTPAIFHTEMVPGDKIKITLAPKGAGSENMSRIKMLKPSDSVDGVKDFVLETVKLAGGKPCPPIILGIGIGGNFEYAAYLSKKALLRPLGVSSDNQETANLEKEILDLVNNLNIGPMGLGGKTTCLACNILTYPCHIASLPVAVNIQCHVARHIEVII